MEHTPIAELIYLYIKEHPNCTRLQILQGLEILEYQFKKAKDHLVGRIKVTGSGKRFTYKVIK